jgi:thiol-disulfide isomerase/thioredoxin
MYFCSRESMKKSLIIVIVLAVIAGATGVAIGLAVARVRRATRNSSGASHNPTAAVTGPAEDAPKNTVGGAGVIRFAKDPAPTPPFLVNDVEGKSVSTAQLRGKVVLVNFWATWCPPCRAEIPELIALQDKYKDRLQIIGVSMDDDASPAQVKAFAAKAGINYPIVMGAEIAKEYGGVPALPTSFVVNKDGGIVQKHVGMLVPDEIETEVRALLGMPVSAKIETFVDTGQIFLKNAERATELPDVDLTGLTPQQKAAVLKRLNSETCTCGCGLTMAQCRINDTTCPVSSKLAAQVVQEVKSGITPSHPPATPATTAPSVN